MRLLIADWLGLLFIVAIVYVLVRPTSKGAELVEAVSNMMVALVRRATDVANT